MWWYGLVVCGVWEIVFFSFLVVQTDLIFAQYMILFTPSSPKGGQRVLDAQSVLVQKHPLAGPLITVQLSGEKKNLWLTGFLIPLTYVFFFGSKQFVQTT